MYAWHFQYGIFATLHLVAAMLRSTWHCNGTKPGVEASQGATEVLTGKFSRYRRPKRLFCEIRAWHQILVVALLLSETSDLMDE